MFGINDPSNAMLRKNYREVQSAFGYFRRQKISNAVVAATTRLKTGQATSASAITTVSSFTLQPDVPRTIGITPGGTTADVPAGDVTVNGTNIRGETISDTITFAANASTIGSTTKAFKTVTSVVFPIQDGAGATYDIGVNDKLGLDRCMEGDEVLYVTVDGVWETTRPTVTAHATDVSKNTIDPNATLNGAKDLVVGFMSVERTAKNGSTT